MNVIGFKVCPQLKRWTAKALKPSAKVDGGYEYLVEYKAPKGKEWAVFMLSA